MQARKYFVAGSGTDIGKTYVLCRSIEGLRTRGLKVEAVKPIVSGFDPAAAEASDPGLIARALGVALTGESLDRISPWRFRAALSPDMAAAREGHEIALDRVLAHCRNASSRAADIIFAEGAGGVMTPLNESNTFRDLIVALDWPVLLVGGAYLGAISHVLTAYEALQKRSRVAAIVLSASSDNPVDPHETADCVRRFAGTTPVHLIGRNEAASEAFLDAL
jgi:dethiobiotin synthetase